MLDLNVLRYMCFMVTTRLGVLHDDERGAATLEQILWIAGLAVMALAAIVVVTAKVTTAEGGIPTGPSGP